MFPPVWGGGHQLRRRPKPLRSLFFLLLVLSPCFPTISTGPLEGRKRTAPPVGSHRPFLPLPLPITLTLSPVMALRRSQLVHTGGSFFFSSLCPEFSDPPRLSSLLSRGCILTAPPVLHSDLHLLDRRFAAVRFMFIPSDLTRRVSDRIVNPDEPLFFIKLNHLLSPSGTTILIGVVVLSEYNVSYQRSTCDYSLCTFHVLTMADLFITRPVDAFSHRRIHLEHLMLLPIISPSQIYNGCAYGNSFNPSVRLLMGLNGLDFIGCWVLALRAELSVGVLLITVICQVNLEQLHLSLLDYRLDKILTSLPFTCSTERESPTSMPLLKRATLPVRVILVQRIYSRLASLQTAITRTLVGFLKAASLRSIFGKCLITRDEHLDPIGGSHASMSFEDLSFSFVLNVVCRIKFYPLILWFEDAIKMKSGNL